MNRFRLADLPTDPVKRDELLRSHFSSLLVVASEPTDQGDFEVAISRPELLEAFVDPGLGPVLVSLGVHEPAQIGEAVWQEDGFQLSLEDSWTAVSWSRWLAAQQVRSRQQAVILHVDDHYDFEAPHIALEETQFRDLFTARTVSLLDPPSVAAAVSSGAIGVAGFFSPFLRCFDEIEIRHLRTRVPAGVSGWHELTTTVTNDPLFNVPRPGLRLGPDVGARGVPLRYLGTSVVDDWLEGLPDWPVLLHVDLDYLSNRYNGDSDWHLAQPEHDPLEAVVHARLDEVLDGLEGAGDALRVENISIALSPGFFPAEWWSGVLSTLRERVPQLIRQSKS